MEKKEWYRELLRYGKEIEYFSNDAFLDFANEQIRFTPNTKNHMKFSDWETYRVEGESPKTAIDTYLSYA